MLLDALKRPARTPKEHGFSFADQRLAQDTIDCQPAYPTHQMGTSYRFISAPSDSDAVLTWFRELPEPPREIAAAQHSVLYFAHLGGLQYGEDGEVDAEKSPIVTIVPLERLEAHYGRSAKFIFLPARSENSTPRFTALAGRSANGLAVTNASIHPRTATTGIATIWKDPSKIRSLRFSPFSPAWTRSATSAISSERGITTRC